MSRHCSVPSPLFFEEARKAGKRLSMERAEDLTERHLKELAQRLECRFMDPRPMPRLTFATNVMLGTLWRALGLMTAPRTHPRSEKEERSGLLIHRRFLMIFLRTYGIHAKSPEPTRTYENAMGVSLSTVVVENESERQKTRMLLKNPGGTDHSHRKSVILVIDRPRYPMSGLETEIPMEAAPIAAVCLYIAATQIYEETETALPDGFLEWRLSDLLSLPSRIMLERAMTTETELPKRTLLLPSARTLVWSVKTPGFPPTFFRIAEDGTFANEEDEGIKINAFPHLKVAHPAEMTEEQTKRWSQIVMDYGLLQPFEQIGRVHSRTHVTERSQVLRALSERTVGRGGNFLVAGMEVRWMASGRFSVTTMAEPKGASTVLQEASMSKVQWSELLRFAEEISIGEGADDVLLGDLSVDERQTWRR